MNGRERRAVPKHTPGLTWQFYLLISPETYSELTKHARHPPGRRTWFQKSILFVAYWKEWNLHWWLHQGLGSSRTNGRWYEPTYLSVSLSCAPWPLLELEWTYWRQGTIPCKDLPTKNASLPSKKKNTCCCDRWSMNFSFGVRAAEIFSHKTGRDDPGPSKEPVLWRKNDQNSKCEKREKSMKSKVSSG